MAYHVDSPILELPGVGEVRAKQLANLGLHRVGDLLAHYPREYEDRRKRYTIQGAPSTRRVCIEAMVAEPPRRTYIRQGLELVRVKVADRTGVLYLTFFNQNFVENVLRLWERYVFYGVIEEKGIYRSMNNPIFEPVGSQTVTGCLVPIYPLTAGVKNHRMLSYVRRALDCTGELMETLPRSIRETHNLVELEYAVRNIHIPSNERALELARRRLMFEELFYLTVGLTALKMRRAGRTQGRKMVVVPIAEYLEQLPFVPTGAQRRVMEEIATDMQSGRPMNRLIQGDVGSGKTVVAAYAVCLAARSGYQSAMMVPTEVLAEQHYHTLSTLLEGMGIRVGRLTGTMRAAEKRAVKQGLASGELDFVIGTHALLSESVSFARLALMIADEQHRFGVAQRAALAGKSEQDGSLPHSLVMSATPIPRTLALIVYGDLDVSVIDELPSGRTPVETYVIREDKRERMYRFVRKQVEQGRQVYLICPAVEEEMEEDDAVPDLKAVKSYAERLQREVFPDLTVGLLYGKMKPREKESVMTAFAVGQISILVATTVVEVGVDVPNASLIVIENADRFGLSQLHQLRGRVGRGSYASYCVLVTGSRNPDTMHRLKTMASTTDGFLIAEEDLKARGPGDFFGNRQHGMPHLKLADLGSDMALLQEAQAAAQEMLEHDPQLIRPEHRSVVQRVRKMFADTPDIFN